VEDEYIFHCLKNFPKERLHLLNAKELTYLEKESNLRAFVNHGSHDAKKIMMAKAGYYFVCLYINENLDPELEKLFDRKYKDSTNNEKREMIHQMINKRMFATSSREIISQAYLIAQNCHTPYFFVNQDYARVLSEMETIRTKQLLNFKDKTDTQLLNEAEKARQTIAAMVLAVHNSESYIKVQMKLSVMDLNILLFLFYYRETHVTFSAIVKQFYQYSKANISNRLFALKAESYIVAGPRYKEARNYTIAESGIITVCEYLERLTSKALEL
jgi:hypothetical protein